VQTPKTPKQKERSSDQAHGARREMGIPTARGAKREKFQKQSGMQGGVFTKISKVLRMVAKYSVW